MMPTESTTTRGELARITLSVLFIGALIAGSAWVLRPFLAALIWATMIVVATWPLLLRVERACGGRRGPAVAVMTLGMLAMFILPLGAALDAVFGVKDEARALVASVRGAPLPAAPAWLPQLPVVGERAAAKWNETSAAGTAALLARAEPYARGVATWFAHQAGTAALMVVHFMLIVVLAAVLYAGGEAWGAWMRRFGQRLAGLQGDRMVVLAGQAIRGVALGVVVTALLQTGLSALGLFIVGVPFAGVLTAIILVLCVAQLGPILVLLGATAWAFASLGPGWGSFLLVWSLVVGLMDNFVRPVLIRRGADLPLLLIFAGVIGGLVAFGVVGIFVGPVVLAVTYTLVDDWVGELPKGPGSRADSGADTIPALAGVESRQTELETNKP
jgi:predicted PurR-regulated permease PerM